jgi:hypothetical protein
MLSSLRSKSIPLAFTRILRPAVALTVICVTSITLAAAGQNEDIHTRVDPRPRSPLVPRLCSIAF